MNTRWQAIPLIVAFVLMLSGQASAREMTADETWSGTVLEAEQVVVEKGVTLTILPGTKVLFAKGEMCEEGIADNGLFIKGTLVADGTPDARITFASGADNPAPGDWGEIWIVEGVGCSVSFCDFSGGGWGLHIHDTDLKVECCTFRDNSQGGLRGKGGRVEISRCKMEGLDIGIRYWQGAPSIHQNEFAGCGTAIFCRQDCEGARIRHNNIVDSVDYGIKLGDGQAADIDASNNWWGTTDVDSIRAMIFDHDRENYIGRVIIEPVLEGRVDTSPRAETAKAGRQCLCSQ